VVRFQFEAPETPGFAGRNTKRFVSARLLSHKLFAEMIMPNPAREITYVTFIASDEYKYVILTDMSGKVFQQKNGVALKGENKVGLDVRGYANDAYIVTLIGEKDERRTMKLMKE